MFKGRLFMRRPSRIGSAVWQAASLLLGLVLSSGATASSARASDFNGDGKADIIWYSATTGSSSIWLMNGTGKSGSAVILSDPNWKVIQTPDLNGDGKS